MKGKWIAHVFHECDLCRGLYTFFSMFCLAKYSIWLAAHALSADGWQFGRANIHNDTWQEESWWMFLYFEFGDLGIFGVINYINNNSKLTVSSHNLSSSCCLKFFCVFTSQRPPCLFLSSSHIGSIPSYKWNKFSILYLSKRCKLK